MQDRKINHFLLAGFLMPMLVLSGCGGAGGTTATDKGTSNNVVSQTEQPVPAEKPTNYFWQIKVNDSSTINIGQIVSTTQLDLTAENPQKGIVGHYSGLGSGETFNSNAAYGSTSQAGVKNSLQWDFTVEYAPAPLTGSNSGDDKLAPLTNGENEPEYYGAGTITMAPRTATVTGAGTSTTKKLEGTSYPIEVGIFADHKVRLTLKTPQGSVYFDGELVKK